MKITIFVPDMSFSDEEDDTDEQVSIPGLDHPGALPMMGGHPMGATPPHLTPGNMSDHSSSSAHTLTPTPNKYETNNNSLAIQQPPMVSPHNKDGVKEEDLEMDEDLKEGDDDKGNTLQILTVRVQVLPVVFLGVQAKRAPLIL